MVRLSGLPERWYKRPFRKATGLSPLEYMHALRLEEAMRRLEGDDTRIEAIERGGVGMGIGASSDGCFSGGRDDVG